MFRQDVAGDALHSQTNADIVEYISTKYGIPAEELIPFCNKLNTWQMLGGYNKFYDDVFSWGTNGNMDYDRIFFSDNGLDYVIWYWRGDYLNLGAGAEIGLYYKNPSNPIQSTISADAEEVFDGEEHWFSSKINVPMTLSLYWEPILGVPDLIPLFNWAPENPQWWITGFDPNWRDDVDRLYGIDYQLKTEDLLMIGSVDLSQFSGDAIDEIKEYLSDEIKQNRVIIDEKYQTIWFVFGRMI